MSLYNFGFVLFAGRLVSDTSASGYGLCIGQWQFDFPSVFRREIPTRIPFNRLQVRTIYVFANVINHFAPDYFLQRSTSFRNHSALNNMNREAEEEKKLSRVTSGSMLLTKT